MKTDAISEGSCDVGIIRLQKGGEEVRSDRLMLPAGVLKPFCAKDLALTFITHADIFNARKVR